VIFKILVQTNRLAQAFQKNCSGVYLQEKLTFDFYTFGITAFAVYQ
jgi:hypothetical protein